MKKNKRENYFINPSFQFWFIRLFSCAGVGTTLIAYGSNLYFFWKFKQLGLKFGLNSDSPFFNFISSQSKMMDVIFIGTSLAIIGLSVILGIIYSHRIAGPMYHLEKSLNLAAEKGQYQEIHFRKNDHFHEVSKAVNKAFSVLIKK